MTDNSKPMPSPSELEILKILWESGPSTVPVIHVALERGGEATYTTTLKQVQRLSAKDLIKKCGKMGRADIFEALCSQSQIRRRAMKSFLYDVFDGSASALIVNALGASRPNSDEIDKIRKLLDEIEDRKGRS